MNIDITLLVSIFAMAIMIYALFQVIMLKKHIPGGMVGKNWNYLLGLVVLFAAGYVAMPFLEDIPPDTLRLIVASILLFGGIYVVITIKLIYNIIRVLSE